MIFEIREITNSHVLLQGPSLLSKLPPAALQYFSIFQAHIFCFFWVKFESPTTKFFSDLGFLQLVYLLVGDLATF